MNGKQISNWQFLLISVNFILGTVIFMLTSSLVDQGKQDAWLIPIWFGAIGSVIALLWIYLGKQYPGQSPAVIPILVLGRTLGIAVTILHLLYFITIAGFVLRNLSDFLRETIMPRTPEMVFHIMFIFVAGFTVLKGVEVVARSTQFIAPFLFFPFWLTMILALHEWDWNRLQPVFGTDLAGTFVNNLSFLGFPYLEALALWYLMPYVQKHAGRTLILGIGVAALTLSLVLFLVIGELGVDRASMLTYPVYTLIQEVSFYGLIVSIHSVISVVLLILVYIKVLILVLAIYEIIKQVFRPETGWPHIVGIGIMSTAMASVIYQNAIQILQWHQNFSFYYMGLFGIVIPTFLIAIGWVKKRWAKKFERSGG
jgi:spore germination protein KB